MNFNKSKIKTISLIAVIIIAGFFAVVVYADVPVTWEEPKPVKIKNTFDDDPVEAETKSETVEVGEIKFEKAEGGTKTVKSIFWIKHFGNTRCDAESLKENVTMKSLEGESVKAEVYCSDSYAFQKALEKLDKWREDKKELLEKKGADNKPLYATNVKDSRVKATQNAAALWQDEYKKEKNKIPQDFREQVYNKVIDNINRPQSIYTRLECDISNQGSQTFKWETFKKISGQPECNWPGSYNIAMEDAASRIYNERSELDARLNWGQGFESKMECEEEKGENCIKTKIIFPGSSLALVHYDVYEGTSQKIILEQKTVSDREGVEKAGLPEKDDPDEWPEKEVIGEESNPKPTPLPEPPVRPPYTPKPIPEQPPPPQPPTPPLPVPPPPGGGGTTPPTTTPPTTIPGGGIPTDLIPSIPDIPGFDIPSIPTITLPEPILVRRQAAFRVFECGNELDLKDPDAGEDYIGTLLMHEENDNLVHISGLITNAKQISLKWFFQAVGGFLGFTEIDFPTNNGIVVRKNGDLCSDQKAGNWQVFLMQDGNSGSQRRLSLSSIREYIISDELQVPPGDCIVFEFNTESKSKTANICRPYQSR